MNILSRTTLVLLLAGLPVLAQQAAPAPPARLRDGVRPRRGEGVAGLRAEIRLAGLLSGSRLPSGPFGLRHLAAT